MMTHGWLVSPAKLREHHVFESFGAFRSWLRSEDTHGCLRTAELGTDRFIGFLLGFSDWRYLSSKAKEFGTDLFKRPIEEQHAFIAPYSIAFNTKRTLPIYLLGTDSIDDLVKEHKRKPSVQRALKSLDVTARTSELEGWSTLGQKQLLQFILLARMALQELEPRPTSDALWTESFVKYLDAESALLALKQIAAWPTDGTWSFILESV